MNIKKVMILFVSGAVLSGQIFAAEIQHSIKYGLNASVVKTNEDGITSESKSGYSIGYQALKPLSDKLAVSIGIEYSEFNSDYDYDGSTYEGQSSWIEIPVLVHRKYNDKLSFQFGGYLGLLHDSSISMGDISYTPEQSDINYGVAFGASYNLDKNWVLEARYQLGIKDINPSNTSITDEDENLIGVKQNESKINVVTIALGYKF